METETPQNDHVKVVMWMDFMLTYNFTMTGSL